MPDSEWLEQVQAGPERGREAGGPPGSRSGRPPVEPPSVVVCDEGELDDVLQLLRDLDQNPLRLRPEDLSGLHAWELPSRLLISSVRAALANDLPLRDASETRVSIAVADCDSQTLCTAMLQRGFRYVVRRPVHPEALRLLLLQVLWRGRENRVVARFPFGAEIGWRSGLRRGTCTMVEVSAHGCRLASRDRFRVGDPIRLRVPAALTGSRDLRLRGRVVRRDLPEGATGSPPQVAVQFEDLSARSFAHLDALLAERASGPAVMAGDAGASAPPRRAARRGPSRFRSLTRTDEPAAPEARSPELERRRRPRGVWQREVVALERDSDRVLHTLLGSDLSPGGMRVEANPLLRLGDRLRLALYDADRAEPLVLEARVAREGGRHGVGLVFEHPGDEARDRLARMVAALPPLSSLSQDGEKPSALVLGEIVALEAGGRSGSAEAGEQQQREAEHAHGDADHDDDEA